MAMWEEESDVATREEESDVATREEESDVATREEEQQEALACRDVVHNLYNRSHIHKRQGLHPDSHHYWLRLSHLHFC